MLDIRNDRGGVFGYQKTPSPHGRCLRKRVDEVCQGSVVVPNLHHNFLDTHVYTERSTAEKGQEWTYQVEKLGP